MSRFYASIQGNRGQATRQGTPKSGIEGHIRGWDIGAKISCWVNKEGKDVVQVAITGGSSDSGIKKDLGMFTREDIK